MLTRSKALVLLGISKNNPDDAELKKAYKRMASKHHPDKGGDAEKFKQVKTAYEFLLEDDSIIEEQYEQKRSGASSYSQQAHQKSYQNTVDEMMRQFDEQLRRDADKSAGNSWDTSQQKFVDIGEADPFGYCDNELDRMKKKDATNTGYKHNRTIADIQTCTLNLKQAMIGTSWNMIFGYKNECSRCSGTGQITNDRYAGGWNGYYVQCPDCEGEGATVDVKKVPVEVPPGTQDGDKTAVEIQVSTPTGGVLDRITVIFHVEEDMRYKVNGNHLYLDVDVPFETAILGGKVEFKTLTGTKISLNIMSHTKSGTLLRIPGYGLGNGGDLFCVVNITVPDVMSDEQIECIQQFRDRR